MGFLDKVKDTAGKAAEKAKHGADLAQDKIEEQKLKKHVGELKEELGGVVYAQRAGTGDAAVDAEAEITRLVGEIQADEARLAEHGSQEATNAEATTPEATSPETPTTETPTTE